MLNRLFLSDTGYVDYYAVKRSQAFPEAHKIRTTETICGYAAVAVLPADIDSTASSVESTALAM